MRKQVLMVLSAAILTIPGVLLAQQDVGQAGDRADAVVTVVNLKYYAANEMTNILRALSQDDEIQIVTDENANRLILRGPQKQMSQLVALIGQLDVQTESQPQTESLFCRVYMVELPPKQSDLKPFTVVLRIDGVTPSSSDLMAAVQGEGLQIARLLQGSEWTQDGEPRILIRGTATSHGIVQQMIESIPNSLVTDLKWGEETAGDAASQAPSLPGQLYEHIRKFLGDDVKTVGYWFGSFSSPGEAEVPIGPWSLQLKTKPAQAGNLSIEVNVTQNPQFTMDTSTTILSNSIQGKVGKPIIIGYNRDSFGTRTMGAMVILLEADTSGGDGA